MRRTICKALPLHEFPALLGAMNAKVRQQLSESTAYADAKQRGWNCLFIEYVFHVNTILAAKTLCQQFYKNTHKLRMRRPDKLVHNREPLQGITAIDQYRRVAGETLRVAGHIHDARHG